MPNPFRTLSPRSLLGLRRTFLARALVPLVLFVTLPSNRLNAQATAIDCPAGAEGARCTRIEVPADATGSGAVLSAVVFPAAAASMPPLLVLPGGPGESGVAVAGALGRLLAGAFADRDVVFVDQRGTGAEDRLDCALEESSLNHVSEVLELLPEGVTRSCLERLFAHTGPAELHTLRSAADLIHAIRALGYEAVDVFALSWGTRTALLMERGWPDRVGALALFGPVGFGLRPPLHYAADLETALLGMIDECEATPACAEKYPSLRGDYRDVVTAATGGISVTMPSGPFEGEVLILTGGQVGYTFRSAMSSRAGADRLPSALAAAARGDWTQVIEGYRRARILSVPEGVYVAAMCAEEVARTTQREVDEMRTQSLLGDFVYSELAKHCDLVGGGDVPPEYDPTLERDVPVLLMTGAWDPSISVRRVHELAATLPNSQVVVLPRSGHTLSGSRVAAPCLIRITREFLDKRRPETDTSCIRETPPFEPVG